MATRVKQVAQTRLRDQVRVLDLLDEESKVMTYTEIANVLRVSPKRCREACEALEETGEVFCRHLLLGDRRTARFFGTMPE